MYAIYYFLIDCNQKPVINSMNLKGRHVRHRHLILLSELVKQYNEMVLQVFEQTRKTIIEEIIFFVKFIVGNHNI